MMKERPTTRLTSRLPTDAFRIKLLCRVIQPCPQLSELDSNTTQYIGKNNSKTASVSFVVFLIREVFLCGILFFLAKNISKRKFFSPWTALGEFITDVRQKALFHYRNSHRGSISQGHNSKRRRSLFSRFSLIYRLHVESSQC